MIKLNKVLSRYGQLKSFHLEKEKDEIISKGYAFWEYIDEESTEAALKFLNGFNLDGKVITVKKAEGQDSIPEMTVQEDLNLSDYDRVRQQIQTKEKNELEERIKKQQELERKRAFDLLNSNYISQNESKTQQPSAHVEVPTSSIQPPPHPTNPPYHAPSYPPHPSHPYPPAPYYYPSPPTYPAPTYPPYSGYPPYPAPYPSPYHPYAAPKYPPGPISPLGPMAPLNQYPKYPGYPDPKNAMYRPPVPYGQPGQMEPFPYRYTSPESVPSSVPPVRQDDSGTIAQMQPRPIENIVKKPIDETSNIIWLENFLKTEDLVEDEE